MLDANYNNGNAVQTPDVENKKKNGKKHID
jgi:hypothetical protein